MNSNEKKKIQVAAVILNYNSDEDLIQCIGDLKKQKNIRLSLIIVDNNSRLESKSKIKDWLEANLPSIVHLSSYQKISQMEYCDKNNSKDYIVWNSDNGGYSKGNNIGIQVAEKLNADTVLIINPDVRLNDCQYVEKLYNELMIHEEFLCAGSSIINIEGQEQSPTREPSFLEEVFWPLEVINSKLGIGRNYLQTVDPSKVSEVHKISGCCMLLKLQSKNDYLDNNLFLYCEEAVLSAKIKSKGGKIIFIPYIKAYHMHKPSSQEKSLKHLITWCESRWYYTANYSSYSSAEKIVLRTVYKVRKWVYKILMHRRKRK